VGSGCRQEVWKLYAVVFGGGTNREHWFFGVVQSEAYHNKGGGCDPPVRVPPLPLPAALRLRGDTIQGKRQSPIKLGVFDKRCLLCHKEFTERQD